MMHIRRNPHLSFKTYHETPHDEVIENISNLLGVPQKKLKVEPFEDMRALAQYLPQERKIRAQPFLLDYQSDFEHPAYQNQKYIREDQGGILTKRSLLKEILTHEQAHDYFCQHIMPQIALLMQTGNIRFPAETTIDTCRRDGKSLDEMLGRDTASELFTSTRNSQLTALNEAFAEWITTEIVGYETLFEEKANSNAVEKGYDGKTLKSFYRKFQELGKEHGAMTVAYNIPGIVEEHLNTRENTTLTLQPKRVIFVSQNGERSHLLYTGQDFPDEYIFVKPEPKPTTVFAVHPGYKTID